MILLESVFNKKEVMVYEDNHRVTLTTKYRLSN